MKNLSKRILAMLLAVSIALPLLPMHLLAEDSQNSPYIYLHDEDIPYWHRSPHRYAYKDQTGGEHSGYIPAMYQLTDGEDNLAVYCCDLVTSIEPGTAYRRINLEDAGYYDAQAAAHIRGILRYGYWVGRDISNLAEKKGIDNLTAAEAMSATQCAIWHFANADNLTNIYVETKAITNTSDIKDPQTVDAQEASSPSTEKNIRTIYNYLIGQTDSVPATVIWSFEGEQTVLTAKNDLSSYDVTVKFKMKGSKESATNLVLSAGLFNGSDEIQTKSFDISGSDLSTDESGYYTVTFKDVKEEQLSADSHIQLKLSGLQNVKPDVYFYEPVDGRNTAQCFVGYGEGETPIDCIADVAVEKGTATLSLKKYDATMSDNANSYPIPGIRFALYVSVDGGQTYLPYPGMTDKTTDANGEIVWEGLMQASNIQYAYQEVDTPSGYLSTDNLLWGVFDANGRATVGNSHALGDLTISKSVSGTDSNRHFDFRITLDYSTADLTALQHLTPSAIAGRYSILPAVYTGTNSCGQTHSDPVTFSSENGRCTAQISLADHESVTLSGIPLGTGYTVSELTETGGELAEGQPVSFSGQLYVCPDTTQSGTISGTPTDLQFVNLQYEAGSLIVSGKKYLDGVPARQPFSFSLTDVTDPSNPVLIETAENNQNGVILFSPIRYEKPGAYRYQVRETGSGGNYSRDTSVYDIAVEVTQNTQENKLTAAAPVITKSGSPADEIAFYNKTNGSGDGSTHTYVTVNKVWKVGQNGQIPASVRVALLKNGMRYQTAVLNDGNNWSYTWQHLDDDYTWTVAELDVPQGFTSSVSRSGQTFTITNSAGSSETPLHSNQPGGSNPVDLGNTTLPQTGSLWWPVPLLLGGGSMTLIRSFGRRRRLDEK